MSPETLRTNRLQEALSYERFYIILTGLFIAFLISCNLIFNKFFVLMVDLPFGGSFTFEQSVGILPYPLTFLVTDILSEVYGRRRANQAVTTGLIASVCVVGLVLLADSTEASPHSYVDDRTFHHVFGLQWAAVSASMAAYLAAQYLDIRFFHFWRRLTRGRHLWLRNNASMSRLALFGARVSRSLVRPGSRSPVLDPRSN